MGQVKQETKERESTPLPERDPPTENNPAKKRTKSGCLTCRKRRIKCGEERPVCKNCIKSKRECSGYVQPLVYKQHNGAPAGHVYEPYPVAPSHIYPSVPYFPGHDAAYITTQPPAPHAQPERYPHYGHYDHNQPLLSGPHAGFSATTINGPVSAAPVGWPHIQGDHDNPHGTFPQQPSQGDARHYSYDATAVYPVPVAPSSTPMSGMPLYGSHTPWIQPTRAHEEGGPSQSSTHSAGAYLSNTVENSSDAFHHSYASAKPFHTQGHQQQHHIPTLQSSHTTSFESESGWSEDPERGETQRWWEDPPLPLNNGKQHSRSVIPGQLPRDESTTTFANLPQAIESHWAAHSNISQRPTAMTAYHPSLLQAPLYDDRSKEIFRWFITVTSGCISIFERVAIDATIGFSKTLWGYSMPTLSISHSALTYAILALSSLHHAKVNKVPEDIASKHFTYAVRRVGKLLDQPDRRHEVATLAAVLLLGFYEVMAADHSRWNLHLAGAKQLVTEHDYAGMTRCIRAMRSASGDDMKLWNQGRHSSNHHLDAVGEPEVLLDDGAWDVDETLVSRLCGKEILYDSHYQPNFPQSWYPTMSETQIQEFQSKMDLRWWYCKQDIFQSMVSGDPLLLPFNEWTYCPPRGRIGKPNIAYATMDHLLLIMGRLTDFGGKDRTRKQRAIAAQGGQWRPPPGLFSPPGSMPPTSGAQVPQNAQARAPSNKTREGSDQMAPLTNSRAEVTPVANEGRVRQSKTAPQPPAGSSGPGFQGMMPPPNEPVQMSSSFRRMNAKLQPQTPETSRVPAQNISSDLEADTAKALAEHAAIVRAFDTFEQALGPDFQALPVDETDTTTPFGPSQRYTNHSIACIWTFYYVGRILLHRLHPQMPPAAMVAAGVVAQHTAKYAQKVGQICAGLYSSSSPAAQYGEITLDTYWTGALIESTFPLLFAAIQFRDALQRSWTISKLQTIAQITGWKSAAAIAAALETAWEKMGQANRGPPYRRTLDNSKDDRLKTMSTGPTIASGSRKSSILDDHEGQFVIHDRNLIDRQGPARVHWALGILSVEEDIRKLNLGDH